MYYIYYIYIYIHIYAYMYTPLFPENGVAMTQQTLLTFC